MPIKFKQALNLKIVNLFKAIFIMMVLLPMSCTEEEIRQEKLPDLKDGYVHIKLFTNAGDYNKPAVKTGVADEFTVSSDPWVLVFLGNGDNTIFVEAQQAY